MKQETLSVGLHTRVRSLTLGDTPSYQAHLHDAVCRWDDLHSAAIHFSQSTALHMAAG